MIRLEKVTMSGGDTRTFPTVGDEVTVEYTGWLHSALRGDRKGRRCATSSQHDDLLGSPHSRMLARRFDSSQDHGPLTVNIGKSNIFSISSMCLC